MCVLSGGDTTCRVCTPTGLKGYTFRTKSERTIPIWTGRVDAVFSHDSIPDTIDTSAISHLLPREDDVAGSLVIDIFPDGTTKFAFSFEGISAKAPHTLWFAAFNQKTEDQDAIHPIYR